MIAAIGELVTPVSVSSSILLGGMIGAFYGYEIAPSIRPRFPVSLWTIGLAFIVMIALFTLQDVANVDPQRSIPFAIGRGVLWTVTCVSIPAGRASRRWLQRKFRRSKKGANEEENT